MAQIKYPIKFGIIGMSHGNGHPYSWSAIFNGYDKDTMAICPFPVIPEYLSAQQYPDDFLSGHGLVTSVWTQDFELSSHISKASKIDRVCHALEELKYHCDAILLARDDAENHLKMSEPFLDAGLPVFIDKPFALNMNDAKKMLSLQQYETQIFTCSSLRFASELLLTDIDRNQLGKIRSVEAYCPKHWDTYGIHLIEPVIKNITDRGNLLQVQKNVGSSSHTVEVTWENFRAQFVMTKEVSHPLEFCYYGEANQVKKVFTDSFSCFKKSLLAYVIQIQTKEQLISRKETLEMTSIIEYGR